MQPRKWIGKRNPELCSTDPEAGGQTEFTGVVLLTVPHARCWPWGSLLPGPPSPQVCWRPAGRSHLPSATPPCSPVLPSPTCNPATTVVTIICHCITVSCHCQGVTCEDVTVNVVVSLLPAWRSLSTVTVPLSWCHCYLSFWLHTVSQSTAILVLSLFLQSLSWCHLSLFTVSLTLVVSHLPSCVTVILHGVTITFQGAIIVVSLSTVTV